MDARRLVSAVAMVGLAAAAACSATKARTPAPPPAATTAAPVASTSTAPLAQVTATAPVLTPEQKLAMAVEAARTCEVPVAKITNAPPESGVVFNNAQTDPDAGYIDRLAEIVSTIRDTADYRCCFDSWQTEHPDQALEVMLQLTLDPDGAVKEAGVDAERTSADDEVLVGCLGAVARNQSFPPSPTGKDTHVDYPFVVAARDTGP